MPLTCSFSGHRIIHRIHEKLLLPALSSAIDGLIESGVSVFQSGGAFGFDLLAAKEILKRRKVDSNIKLVMLLPCHGQTSGWSADSRREYENILAQANDVTYVSTHYSQFCMHLRNRALVDTADILLCYLARENGGTAHTVNYAISKSKRIINIASLL